MSLVFEAPIEFYQSAYLPPICIVTGQQTGITQYELLVPPPRPFRSLAGSGKNRVVPMPFSADGHRRWIMDRMFQALTLLSFPVALLALVFGSRDWMGLLFVAIVALILQRFISRFFLPQVVCVGNPERIRIHLCRNAETIYKRLATAFMLWKEAEQIDTPIAYDLDGWSNEIDPGWDQGAPAAAPGKRIDGRNWDESAPKQ